MDILPGRTARFEAFVAPARRAPAFWRLVVGALLAGAVWLAATVAVLPLARVLPGARGSLVLLLYLLSFAGLILGTVAAVRFLQHRSPVSLIGPRGFLPRQFGLGVAVVLGLGAISALPVLALAPPVRHAGLAAWAAWLPLALPAVLVQTAAEELAFRGYLLQGLAARFRSRLVWWVAPALLFGLLHWSPRDGWLAVLAAAALGLILADVTVRTGNLSAAIGLHFANNAVALLVVAMPSPLTGLSLFVAGVDPADTGTVRLLLLCDLAVTLLAYAVWLGFCARRRRLHSQGAGSI